MKIALPTNNEITHLILQMILEKHPKVFTQEELRELILERAYDLLDVANLPVLRGEKLPVVLCEVFEEEIDNPLIDHLVTTNSQTTH